MVLQISPLVPVTQSGKREIEEKWNGVERLYQRSTFLCACCLFFHPVCKGQVWLERRAQMKMEQRCFRSYNNILFLFWHDSTWERREVTVALILWQNQAWMKCAWQWAFLFRRKDSPCVERPQQLLKSLPSQLAIAWHHLAFGDACWIFMRDVIFYGKISSYFSCLALFHVQDVATFGSTNGMSLERGYMWLAV